MVMAVFVTPIQHITALRRFVIALLSLRPNGRTAERNRIILQCLTIGVEDELVLSLEHYYMIDAALGWRGLREERDRNCRQRSQQLDCS